MIFHLRGKIRQFTFSFAAFCTLLSLGTVSQAETVVAAKPYSQKLPLPEPGNICYVIEARLGWQRVPAVGLDPVELMFFDPDTTERAARLGWPSPPGWSVDAARYAKVGISGHLGADGEALEPFSSFKHIEDEPFGRLLIRNAEGAVWSNNAKLVNIGASPYFEFRINDKDSGLGDNDGYILACPLQKGTR